MARPRPILGRFQLIEPLANGGMASVWRAVHREQGVPAAVKILPGSFANPQLADALRAEIRAVSQLNHVRIVSVYDQGEVDRRAAEASQGMLKEGSPWVALELVDGGTLSGLYKSLKWKTLAAVLRQLLAALGHAHAAGVVHRDLKLANVLVSADGTGIKLADFGIAYAMRSHEDGIVRHAMQAGTPRYMAPEQIQGRIEAQGPWTDLYALGVLAWRLATGETPFPEAWDEAALAKSRGDFAPFRPRFSVPEGFPGWCARMMSPSPSDRFSMASDASHALRVLGPLRRRDLATGPTTSSADDSLPPPLALTLPPATPAPIPATWRAPEQWHRPVELLGCGLRLFGVRGTLFVGRQALRDRLWTQLSRVHHDRRARALVLRGPAGYGKSSLAAWIGRRAEEVGAGVALRTVWTNDPGSGLAGLVARRLRCVGEPANIVRARIEAHLHRARYEDAEEARLLQRLLAPEPDSPPLDQVERFSLVSRTLDRFARERPAVAHLDDAHLNPESFRFVRSLLERSDGSAVLFVITVQEEALAESKDAQLAMAELCAHPQVEEIRVGPLPLEDQVDFVQGLLGLEPQLAARVARRTEGNPLFASQLLDDWVSRDLLELSVEGFRLKNPLDASLPASLTEVWHGRVEALLEATHPHLRVPLELAATLGSQVDSIEWNAICEAAGWPAPKELVEQLLSRRLAVQDGPHWQFVHGMLREAILKSAARAGRLQSHHRSVADYLSTRSGSAVRIGRHLLQAHAGSEAIDPLERGADHAIANGDYTEALHLLRARAALMRQVNLRPDDERWGRGWVTQAELLARMERWGPAASLAQQAANEAHHHGWGRVEVEALMMLVENRSTTDLTRAQGLLQRAYQVAIQPGNEDALAAVCVLASQISRRSGDLEGALAHARRGIGHVLIHGGIRRSRCEIDLAQTLIKLGRLEDAMRHVRRAEQLATRQGHRFDAAVCAYLRANLGREQGDLRAATKGYRDATDRFSVLGDPNSWAMRAHLGLVLSELGDHDRAHDLFEQVLESSSKLGDLLAHLGCLLCRAEDVDDQVFQRHLEAVTRFVDRGWCDPLVAHIVELAATRASNGGFKRRAAALLEISWRQRERLGPAVSASA